MKVSRNPALIVESEDICSRSVENLAITVTIRITITEMVTETIITGDGIIITVDSKETTRITGTITLLNNSSNNNHNNRITIITRSIIFRQTTSNQK